MRVSSGAVSPLTLPSPPSAHGWANWHLPQREREGCFRRGSLGSGLSATFSNCCWSGQSYRATLQHDTDIALLVFGHAGVSEFSIQNAAISAQVRPGDVWLFNLNQEAALLRTSAADQACRMAVIRIDRHRLAEGPRPETSGEGMSRLARGVDTEANLAFLNTNPLDSLSARLTAEGQTLELLAHWLSVSGPEVPLGPDCPVSVRRAVDFLLADLSRTPTLAELTTLTGLSHPSLTRLFQRHFGSSIFSWLRSIRLQRAAYWLAHSDRSITTLALELGFSHGSHLARCFVARFGCTPVRYRADHRG